jgi:cytochrome P450
MRTRSRAPGPRRLRQLGDLRAFRRDGTGFLLEMARRYGDVVRLHLGPRRIFLLSHPDHVQEVLVTRSRLFGKSFGKRMMGEGLVTSDGELHRRQRRLVQPAFHRARVAAYARVMTERAERHAARWKDGETLDLAGEMARLTLQIVGETLFDLDVEAGGRAFAAALCEACQPPSGNALKEALSWMRPAPGSNGSTDRSPFDRLGDATVLVAARLLDGLLARSMRPFQEVRREVDDAIYAMIAARRREGGDRGDLLSMLVLARDEDAGRAGMSDRQARDEIVTLFLAGHETVSSALTWTLYLLSQHPAAAARLEAEVDAVLDGRPGGMDDLARLPLTGQVLAESLRLYPPVWLVSRRVLEDLEIGGYELPAGSMVLVSPWVVHHDRRWWPDPFRFDPERWAPGAEADRPKFGYFPFGGGPRQCIGESFARVECGVVLVTLVRRWRLRLVPGHPVELLPLIGLHPRHGMPMTVELRRGGKSRPAA